MKIKKIIWIIAFGLTQSYSLSVSSDETNSQVSVCLGLTSGDLAATALACAAALQSKESQPQSIQDAINEHVSELKENGELHTEFRSLILEKMRFNRRAFQTKRVLNRYAEDRISLGQDNQVFEQCGLPRNEDGDPLPHYPLSFSDTSHSRIGDYDESGGVIGCLKTKSGLAGKRAEPLAQHYYCTFPGNSPEIRSCFTFQIRVSSNMRSNSHQNILIEDQQTNKTRVINRAGKEWLFAGTQAQYDQAKETKVIPTDIIQKVASYCSIDGRAARATDFTHNPPQTYWHTSFLENHLLEVASHNDPATTNDELIADYLEAKTKAQEVGSTVLDISQIDPPREGENKIRPPLCWVNNTQLSVFQLMLSPALSFYFDREQQLSMIRDYYQCDDENIKREYSISESKMTNYCPESLGHWDD